MRYLGKEYNGRGVTVAVVDSGVNPDDPRLKGAKIEGCSITLGASQHALISGDFSDVNGHGTDMAAVIHSIAPDAKIFAIRVAGKRLGTSAELMAAAIEFASTNGAKVVSLSLGTPNMGKAMLLSECCGQALERGTVVLAAAHPKGERVYPADLPEAIGVAAHRDCPSNKLYYFDPKRFSRKQWGALSGKFLGYGFMENDLGERKFKSSAAATAYLAGRVACMRQAMPWADAEELLQRLKRRALIPVPEIGYG